MNSSQRSVVSGVLLALFAVPSAMPAAEEPWELLDILRQNLGSVPMQASFVQFYQPAGFTSGDRESGRLFLALPGCLRWDYDQPHAKSFLLCDKIIHTWSAGDQAGRRFLLDDSAEPGVDLLRLQLDELKQRYTAQLELSTPEGFAIVLIPKSNANPIAQAQIRIDPDLHGLAGLSYQDREGNQSRFELGDYRPLENPEMFEPPQALEWLDQ